MNCDTNGIKQSAVDWEALEVVEALGFLGLELEV